MKLKECYKHILYESFSTLLHMRGESIEIFKNPSTKELQEIQTEARGIIDNDGNLYLASSNEKEFTIVVHYDIGEKLESKGLLKRYVSGLKSTTQNLNVQRKDKTNNIYLCESYTRGEVRDNMEVVERILKLAQDNNPMLKFYNKTIYDA